MVKIDLERCDGCGKCVEECPMDVFQMASNKAQAVNEEDCMTCYLCETVCPKFAITVVE